MLYCGVFEEWGLTQGFPVSAGFTHTLSEGDLEFLLLPSKCWVYCVITMPSLSLARTGVFLVHHNLIGTPLYFWLIVDGNDVM